VESAFNFLRINPAPRVNPSTSAAAKAGQS
jgi:hypothetical protein